MSTENAYARQGVSAAQNDYVRRIARRKKLVSLARFGIIFVFLALWEIAARMKWIDSFLLSSPSRMFLAAGDLLASGGLALHLGVTLVEMLAGFAIGLALALSMAVALWWFPFLNEALDPYLLIINALPKIALGPVLIVWMGAGMPAIVAMAVLVSVIVALTTILTGMTETPQEKITLMRSLGANKRQILTMLVLPHALPNIVTSIKLAVGMSWVGVIVGEFLVSRAGLGYLIVYGGQVFKLDLVMLSTAILCACAAAMYVGVSSVEKRLQRALTPT